MPVSCLVDLHALDFHATPAVAKNWNVVTGAHQYVVNHAHQKHIALFVGIRTKK